MNLGTQDIDALGNQVIIGNWYGYSQSKNGMSHVVIGQLKKLNDSSVTLRDAIKRDLGWRETQVWEDSRAVSVRACLLFPVDPAKVTGAGM